MPPNQEPTKLKRLKGVEKREINKTEPEPPSELPRPPAWLPEPVRAVFLDTVADLDFMGLASRADRTSLIAFSQAVVEHQRASMLIAKQGVITMGERGQPIRNP